MRTHPRAHRDALTVEIGYALTTGGFLAALVLAAGHGAVTLLPLPEYAASALWRGATLAAVGAFVVRVVLVLHRFGRGTPRPGLRDRLRARRAAGTAGSAGASERDGGPAL
ncbi:DUF6332 family protein [Streptomyces sp. NPDC000594]|uniref:DUF6332 family protein n=1 Tax=Streptomyces sp. NPDC000594 TaxID=3154261 RepID=UPI00332A4348